MNLLLCYEVDWCVLVVVLNDGMVDMIVIDYVLYIEEDKGCDFCCVVNGIIGSEMVFVLLYIKLVKIGFLKLEWFLDLMVINFVEVFNLIEVGYLEVGKFVDIVVFDFNYFYVIDQCDYLFKGINLFFIGMIVYG